MKEDNVVIQKVGGQIYDGVEPGLKFLARKTPLFIVSNCQAGYIETFLDFSGLGPFFQDFECWGYGGGSGCCEKL